jgi:tRNA-specific 2-thiouridylase
VATGHYARKGQDPATGRGQLLRGADPGKDQSYFLFGLDQEQLGLALFPVGHLRKEEVRALARERGLPTADKAESQEICFVPDGDYAAFVERNAGRAPAGGPILDEAGRTLGRHEGIHRFTVGQRKGLGLASPEPLYVLRVLPESQAVVVGPAPHLESSALVAEAVNWVAGETPRAALRAAVRIRHRHPEAQATIEPLEDGRVRVAFDVPQRAAAPGQAAVFYDGEVCLGGGWIARP